MKKRGSATSPSLSFAGLPMTDRGWGEDGAAFLGSVDKVFYSEIERLAFIDVL